MSAPSADVVSEVQLLRTDIARLEQLLESVLAERLPTPAKAQNLPDWLSATQIAAYSGRSYTTVIRALRGKQIRATQASKNSCYRARIEDVDRWMRGEAPLPRTMRAVPSGGRKPA